MYRLARHAFLIYSWIARIYIIYDYIIYYNLN